MCQQFNSMKQTLGIYKQRRDKLGSTTVPTLGRRSQSAIRFNPHTLQTWLCADIVQFWPLSLCHATPRERVQGQQFAHVSSRGVACHRERGQSVLTTFFTLLGSSNNDEDESSENGTKKWICVLSWRLSGLAQFVKCGRFFQELNSKELYPGSKRERKIRRHMFTSSIKRRIRRFDVVVEQSKKCTKKREWCTCRAVVLLIKRIVFFFN